MGGVIVVAIIFLFIRGQLWEVLEQDKLGDSIGNELEEEKLEGSRLVKKVFANTQGKRRIRQWME